MLLPADHPFLSLSSELAELCKPLEVFGIHHFTYLKQFNNGAKVSLSNKPQWIDDYYNLNLYQSSLFEKKPSNYPASFNVWFGDYDLDVYKHGKLYYNTMHSITVTEPQSDHCEFYLFSTSPDNEDAIHFLSNNREIIYHFILYLKDRGLSLFKSADKNKLAIQNICLETSTSSQTISQDKLWHLEMEKRKQAFFQKTPIHRYILEQEEYEGIKLTQRELDCIFHLLQNKTAAETGAKMNISSRTVESYINNLKIKLNCENKLQIIEKFKKNKFLLALR